jgi:succinate dehydrogenase / fumarate reductase cytochrome b subunit
MSKNPPRPRPLSPFMIGPYYRPQLTSMLSIAHRATGVFLSLGTLLLAGWLMAAASGPDAYACVEKFLTAWYGKLVLLGWSYALFYHLSNGIRHLFWDAGYGFGLKQVYLSGYAMVAASVLLTATAWSFAWLLGAAATSLAWLQAWF